MKNCQKKSNVGSELKEILGKLILIKK